MIRISYYQPDGHVRNDLELQDLAPILESQQGVLWVDLPGEPSESAHPILLDIFAFHPLAIDDALIEIHVPKVDDWGRYLYIVLHEVVFAAADSQHVQTLELDIFLGKNYLVTYQSKPVAAVERVWQSVALDERHFKRGASYLLYRIADELATDYMPVVESIDEMVDSIEDEVFSNPAQTLSERIFALRRATLYLRRIIAPQREVLNKLARGDYEVLSPDDRMFFRDVYDHLVRLYDIAEGLRDLVGGVLETYLSVVSNRMNEVMKTLTIITVLFMPLAFLTGFFGMNFFGVVTPLPAWTGRAAFMVALGLFVLVPLSMYIWMRRRAWM